MILHLSGILAGIYQTMLMLSQVDILFVEAAGVIAAFKFATLRSARLGSIGSSQNIKCRPMCCHSGWSLAIHTAAVSCDSQSGKPKVFSGSL